MHLVLVSIEASLDYLKPAAVFTHTNDESSARRLPAFHLPVWTVALCSDSKTEQNLLFSSGVVPVRAPTEPTSWTTYVQEYTRQHQLPGDFAF